MKRLRAVLDTNVVLSALLFRGELSRLHALWKKRAFTPLASRDIMEEYVRVLAYPKFELTQGEIRDLIQEELIPYMEPVVAAVKPERICEDPDDDKFLACAASAKADDIVSGDAHLLSLKRFKGCPIVTAERFLGRFR